jgi:DNA-binding response OmpR family regulator
MIFADVLVVEDDPDLSEVMLLALREAGYAARSAGNGREALEAAARQLPGLVLLDVLMPVMDGWQCARELRARYGRTLAIVVVTAAEQVRARSHELGADDVLAKPFDIDEFLRTVARYYGAPEPATPSVADS